VVVRRWVEMEEEPKVVWIEAEQGTVRELVVR
jgi:hypothetical protein